MNRQSPVVVVRDRPSAGGGIYNYYEAIGKYFTPRPEYTDVGRPYSFYGVASQARTRITAARVFSDWLALLFKIIRIRPKVLVVNPSMDPPTWRSLKRDGVNILIGRLLCRRVISFWRGWDNSVCGQPEFPGGNKCLLSRIFRMAHAHIVLSTRFREDLLRWGFNAPIYVETTVVSDDYVERTWDAELIRRRKPTDLFYLSRIEKAKGIFELIDAYAILKAKNSDYTLTIAGDGPDLQALRERVSRTGLADVAFTGFVTGEQKTECYKRGGVFCFLSYTEGMPNAVLEALGMGIPIVSSDAGGLRDILRDGETGFVIPPIDGAPDGARFNPKIVAEAIERLAKDPELYARATAFNVRLASERFVASKVAKRIEKIYKACLGGEAVETDIETVADQTYAK
jgi:glycosyltransferase involved in cell wall biosynthesis